MLMRILAIKHLFSNSLNQCFCTIWLPPPGRWNNSLWFACNKWHYTIFDWL